MSVLDAGINERLAAEAFSKQAPVFDAIYSANSIVAYKRKRVRAHLERFLRLESEILELNSGTGEDAIYFASKGYSVHATDISIGMQQQLKKKAALQQLELQIGTELRSFTDLAKLENKGPFDVIFSNFGGLNCTPDLDLVLRSLSPILRPGGIVTMVIIPKFCLWESLLIFKGKFKTATRRWFSGSGQSARVEGNYFTCWYYNPSYVKKHLGPSFEVVGLEGLCCIVPPSYIEGFPEKYPKIYKFLRGAENRFKAGFPWKYWGDYYIISLRKKP